MSESSPQRFRFEFFEVDTGSGELRRRGSKVNLQGQPFQVLVLLLERPGQVVTRDELSKQLWPANTFVDSERGLNKAINKIRAALRDDAEKPRFIETLPQRGYRFIAPVEKLAEVHGRFRLQNAPRIDSLAVLPLENLSGDTAQEYFSDGLTEELIYAVARIDSLRVISRTSVMPYKGFQKSLPVIAKELGVDAIVEGSVARSDQKIRITVQLIHATEDRHLWSGRYERDLRDILQLQAEVAHSIAFQIHKVVEPEHAYPERERKVHPQAYEACLKGNFFRDKMSPADLEKSIAFFTRAIELDPLYARAYGDLSRTYFYLGLFGVGPSGEMFPKARQNAAKALELDETVASAHIALAAVHIFHDWDWTAAEAESKRAVELSPGDSVTHAHFADYLSLTGRHSEAVAAYSRVLDLDPISRVYIGHFGLILYRARRYDESIAQCQKALEIDPHYVNGLWFLAISLEQKGDLPGAIAKLEKAVSLSQGPHYRALLGRAYALAGDKCGALEILDELKAVSQRGYVSPFDIAVVYEGLDDRTSAFQYFEEAYQQRVFRIIELTMPMFDRLRSDPRWQNLVRRIGLPQ
jgi:TolB-like protein/Flp pilus assembly protein TadD